MAIDFHIDNQHDNETVSEDFLDWMTTVADALIAQIIKSHSELSAPITELSEIECTLIADERMGEVHGEFMDDPTTTDVITFHHGEILICIDEARRNATENKETLERELAFYLCHGLLHLAGWDDNTDELRDRMLEQQESLLADIYEELGEPPAIDPNAEGESDEEDDEELLDHFDMEDDDDDFEDFDEEDSGDMNWDGTDPDPEDDDGEEIKY